MMNSTISYICNLATSRTAPCLIVRIPGCSSSTQDKTRAVTEVRTCDFGGNQPGIQKAAEWVRTAFHDSVTHDAATKIGGLDASIQYELDRPENLGAALNNTLADISSSVNV